ncbi:unnamed protein product [Phytomonas sp. EM1]|nr:unnamed protein product [Phytomonas sp. EM1]|eukprot:CCW65049.1 unnamed protein product [Phytomonas sp. isolate EM1]
MEYRAKTLPIPSNWVHPDLRRRIQERDKAGSSAPIKRISGWNHLVQKRLVFLTSMLKTKKASLADMESALNMLKQDVANMEREKEELSGLAEGLSNQVYYQKSMAGSAILSGTAQGVLTHSDNFDEPCSIVDAQKSVDGYTCPLEVHFLHLFGRQLGFPLCGKVDEAQVRLFLKSFAPLFSWNDSKRCVQPPFFFDEPCLIEEEGTPCRNVACVYWHKNQLEHIKWAVRQFIRAASRFHVADPRLCAIAAFFDHTWTFVDTAKSVQQISRTITNRIQSIIAMGWHTFLLAPGTEMDAGQRVWAAPIAPMPSTSSLREDLLTNDEERRAWRAAAAAGKSSATLLFLEQPTALMWRCMVRIYGETPEQLHWLADQGRQLFPSSPHLQLLYVHTLIEQHESVESCVETCRVAARTLSAQASAASLTLKDTFCAETISRYVAHIVAQGAVYASRGADIAACVALLEEALGIHPCQAFALLPKARENLTLMLICAKQTGGLSQAECLPLASISDHSWTFCRYFPNVTQELCGQLLAGQLELINSCQRSLLNQHMLDEMKSAAQLSLMRVFSVCIQYMEQIMRKLVADSEISQAVLWSEYIHCIGDFDSAQVASAMALQLITDDTKPPVSCILTVLLIWFMDTPDVCMTDKVLQRCALFMQNVGIDQGEIFSSTYMVEKMKVNPTIPPVEWVSFYILYSMKEETLQQYELLSNIPVALYVTDTNAVVLLLMAQARLAADMDDLARFISSLKRALYILRHPFLMWGSPLDIFWNSLVGIAHCTTLMLYSLVPVLLKSLGGKTMEWRLSILKVGEQFGVLHPLLKEHISARDGA